MGKIWVEVCMISARGLPRSLLWKLQWFAVGWIDPNNKYCTKVDASGNVNPVWRTKFTAVVDTSEASLQDLALHVEVYSREPIFLREKLQGTATVILKEFLAKYGSNPEGSKQGSEDLGSFQLRKKNSNKPHGFIDVSIRISEEREGTSSHLGYEEGFQLVDNSTKLSLATEPGRPQASAQGLPNVPYRQPGNPTPPNYPYTNPTLYPPNYSNPSTSAPSHPSRGEPNYPMPRTPPPPPPPSNVGYIPTFLPRTDNTSARYMNAPPSNGGGRRGGPGGPGIAAGLGTGALAAGAVIFGDDFMSGFDLPSGLQDASLTISADPPF